MKSLKTILLLGLAAALVGCAQPKSKNAGGAAETPDLPPPPPGTTTIDPSEGPWTPSGNGPGQGPGSGSWTFGASAPLEIVSVNRLMEYTMEARNNPTNIRVNVNLTKKGSNTYGGTVTISYQDFGQDFTGSFTSGDSNADNQYNVWLEKDGVTAFHAFFEDGLGAIILVIDEFNIEGGDGAGPGDLVNGKVYFKNFDPNYVPNGWIFWPGQYVERSHCWFISLGPNDCRAWKSGDGVDTYRAIYPDSGYQLLGSFRNLSLDEAFNGDVSF